MRQLLLVLATLCLLPSAARAGEPSDDEKRAEAHKTIMRRFSRAGQAKTVSLKLGAEATAFIDLYLDLERNRHEIRARRAPRSRLFFGTPHAEMRLQGETLAFSAAFANFKIDRADMPMAKVPAVVKAALSPSFVDSVKVATDTPTLLGALRVSMVAALVGTCDEPLRGHATLSGPWKEVREQASAFFLAMLDKTGHRELYTVLHCLRLLGTDDTARVLIKRLEGLPSETPSWVRSMYIRAICGIEGKAARAFALKTLAIPDPRVSSQVLAGLTKDPGEEILKRVETMIFAPNASQLIVTSAVSMLERVNTARSVGLLTRLFDTGEDDQTRYSAACSLTRLGQDKAVPYLEKLVKELEGSENHRARMRASYVKRLLAKYRDMKKGGAGESPKGK